ncbi:MAG: response regulator, partial [Rhodospirillales bacterium]|nr:response regulator [Rhodospirillales bacterium]
ILMGWRRRGERVRIEVWDTGEGIPPAHLPHIFEEFYQVDNPERDRQRGLGLGLAIVQRLALLLETQVEVHSRLGRGSVFWLDLPILGATKERCEPTEPETNAAVPQGTTLVAVIEDEPQVRAAMELVLESWGYRVMAAESADEALTRLRETGQTPHLLIADFRLRGGATGTDAISRVRDGLGRPIPGIIVTGDTDPARVQEAAASGYMLLHKPVEPRVLHEALKISLDTQAVDAISVSEERNSPE